MGHCQGGVYNRQRGRDGLLSGRCIQQTEGSGWATQGGGVYNRQRGRN